MRVVFIFIDGFGLGAEDKRVNPIYAAKAPNILHILNNFRVYPTDCSLGVPGLPQSATGQTAIFTGINASKVLGRHLNGQPTETLTKIIRDNNLFKELKRLGFKVANSNVYRDEYLLKMHDPKDRLHRPSVTSVMTMSSGEAFRTVEDFKRGNGIYHDITGQILIDSGYDVEKISPEEAARRLESISSGYHFTLYEHFMTDIIGHKMSMEASIGEIELLDAFLGGVLKYFDMEKDIIIITSDHGNIENSTVKTHTLNPVPTVVMGGLTENKAGKIEGLTDIMPFVLKLFEEFK